MSSTEEEGSSARAPSAESADGVSAPSSSASSSSSPSSASSSATAKKSSTATWARRKRALDSAISILVVGTAVVLFWRSAWVALDLARAPLFLLPADGDYDFPDADGVTSEAVEELESAADDLRALAAGSFSRADIEAAASRLLAQAEQLEEVSEDRKEALAASKLASTLISTVLGLVIAALAACGGMDLFASAGGKLGFGNGAAGRIFATVAERAATFLWAWGGVLFWRGLWYLQDIYILPDNPWGSVVLTQVLGVGCLLAVNSLRSTVAPPFGAIPDGTQHSFWRSWEVGWLPCLAQQELRHTNKSRGATSKEQNESCSDC